MNEQFYINSTVLEKLFQLVSEKEIASVIHESLTEINGNSPEVGEIISAMNSDVAYHTTFTAEQKKQVLQILLKYLVDKLMLLHDLLARPEAE